MAQLGSRESEFMLKEYERIHSLVLDEVRQSEQRVNFFIAISSAVAGAIVLFLQIQAISLDTKLAVIEVVLVILLIYGLIILSRLSDRMVQLKFLSKLQEKIQFYFEKDNPEISSYLKFKGELASNPSLNSKVEKRLTVYLRGTIHSLIIFTNTVICSGITLTALILLKANSLTVVFLTIFVSVSSAFILRTFHYQMRDRFRPMMR